MTAQNYRRTLTKHRKAKKGHEWTKLERIQMNRIWVNLKKVGLPFFQMCISLYQHNKWFEPRSICSSYSVIVLVMVVLKRTVVTNNTSFQH